MKKFFLTALALSFLPGILPTSSHAQIPYNIVVCNEGTAPHSSASLIRTLSSTDNLLYYRDATTGYVSLCDIYSNMRTIPLAPSFIAHDMEIANGYLFLCGEIGSSACLASVKISDLQNPSCNVSYQTASIPVDKSFFSRMVAYNDPSNGSTKVIAIGMSQNLSGALPQIWNNPAIPTAFASYILSTYYDLCPSYCLYCELNFIVEFTDPQNATSAVPYNFLAVHNKYHDELIYEVVKTDNKVVFAGRTMSDLGIMSLHICNPSSVISTFGTYYYYSLNNADVAECYRGCHMKKDTLALVSFGYSADLLTHQTHLKVIDASSTVMTCSQSFDSDGDYKTCTDDVVYTPEKNLLTVLQEQAFPTGSGSFYSHFINLEPYNTSAYNADALMEMTNKCYNSLDRYTDNERYLASGGDYVLAKKASYSPVSASCYRETRIPVINLLCPSAIPASDLFLTESLLFNTSNVSVTVSYSTYNTNCGE